MTNQQIQCFLVVGRTLSFTRASEEMFVSQPASSRLIAALERELDVRLFDRTGGKVSLTEAGELLYRFFEGTQQEFHTILKTARRKDSLREERFSLGVLSGWSIGYFLVPLSARLACHKPPVALNIESRDAADLIQGLRNHNVDMAIAIDLKPEHFPDFEFREISSPHEIILYSKSNAVAALSDPEPQDFAEEIFWVPPHLYDAKVSTQEVVKRICQRYGFVPETRPVPNWTTMMEYVANGMGVCINTTLARECDNSKFRYKVLESRRPVYLIWNRNNRNALLPAILREIMMTSGVDCQ